PSRPRGDASLDESAPTTFAATPNAIRASQVAARVSEIGGEAPPSSAPLHYAPDPFDDVDESPQDEGPASERKPSALMAWLDDRIGLAELAHFARKKTVPVHRHSVWYYFGGVALLFFIIQLLSGLLLLVYYQPGVSTAHPSVQRLTSQIEFGWL